MACKYLYIDDNLFENAHGIMVGLEKDDELSIKFENPIGHWEQQRQDLLSPDFNNYDGLILDLNLEEMPNKSNIHSKYQGSSLAQEIRNLSKADRMKEIPIILLSATVNLEKYFDKTNEDLFDLILSRENLTGGVFIGVREKMIALSEGYTLINRCKDTNDFSSLFEHDMSSEDMRFMGEIKSVFEYPIHTISTFIIKNLIERSGILISEQILATRLGIDREKSSDWEILLEQLQGFKYSGVYSKGWKRWWMSGLEHWWERDVNIDTSLRSIKVTEKVDILKQKYNIDNLVAIKKSAKAKSEYFWTNCAGNGTPIDPMDGLLIANQDNYYPWQDRCYVCIEEALKPTGKDKWKRLSPSEDFKLEQLKRAFPNERPR